MELEGKIWKEGRWWIVEVPCLNITSQGKTKKNAFLMIKDAVFELMKSYFSDWSKEFNITVHDYKGDSFGLTSNDNKLLLSFLLIRQREESGLSIRDVAERLSSKNPNSYAQYEKGKMNFSINQYEKLMHAINPKRISILRVI
ncbi:MAG: helix-turn-helix transcriptional regulator [Rhabdochlamydiaceae bacterium]|jgi:predicted RNase H-like HicB family nuclease